MRFSLLELEQRAQVAEAAKARVEQQLAGLQQSMEAIVAQHRRTLNGMRDNLKLESLVASLETETAAKQAIQRAAA
ncbi:hypothetical protein ATCC90586_011643 [Pythium insidiosum]|nr:hypothetical protein ATCC90586_011643 [Pythium insidiosum]